MAREHLPGSLLCSPHGGQLQLRVRRYCTQLRSRDESMTKCALPTPQPHLAQPALYASIRDQPHDGHHEVQCIGHPWVGKRQKHRDEVDQH